MSEVGEGDAVSIGLCRLLCSISQFFPPSRLYPVTRPQGFGPFSCLAHGDTVILAEHDSNGSKITV